MLSMKTLKNLLKNVKNFCSMVIGVFMLFAIVTAFLWLTFVVACDNHEKSCAFFGMVTGIMTLCTIIIFGVILEEEPIRPIDVYRGRTTLEITYRDSVAVDSVVVWKNSNIK